MPTIVDELILAYINEKNTHTILPYNPIINKMQNILSTQLEHIRQQPIKLQILYEAEYERLSWFATQIIKLRIHKLINNKYNISNISEDELKFKENYDNLARKYDFYHEDEEEIEEVVEYVCFMVVVDSRSVIIEGNRIDMKYGDVFITEIRDVRDMLVKNEIVLF